MDGTCVTGQTSYAPCLPTCLCPALPTRALHWHKNLRFVCAVYFEAVPHALTTYSPVCGLLWNPYLATTTPPCQTRALDGASRQQTPAVSLAPRLSITMIPSPACGFVCVCVSAQPRHLYRGVVGVHLCSYRVAGGSVFRFVVGVLGYLHRVYLPSAPAVRRRKHAQLHPRPCVL